MGPIIVLVDDGTIITLSVDHEEISSDFGNPLVKHFVQEFKCTLRLTPSTRTSTSCALTRICFEEPCSDLLGNIVKPLGKFFSESKIGKGNVCEIVLVGRFHLYPRIIKLQRTEHQYRRDHCLRCHCLGCMVTFDVDANRILNISTSDHHQQVELHHDHQQQGLLVKCTVNEVEKYKCDVFASVIPFWFFLDFYILVANEYGVGLLYEYIPVHIPFSCVCYPGKKKPLVPTPKARSFRGYATVGAGI